MEVKIGTLYNAAAALRRLSQQALPMRIAVRVQRLVRKAGEEIEAFETLRTKAIRRYAGYAEDGSDVPQGQEIRVPAKHLKAFTDEVAAAAAETVDVPWELCETSELGDVEITPADLTALAWLFSDLDDPEAAGDNDADEAEGEDETTKPEQREAAA